MKKWAVLGTVAFLLVALGLILAVQQKTTDLPPGVSAEMWVPINENAGVALNNWGPRPGYRDSVLAYGTLMVRSQGFWQKVYLETAPASVRPLQVQ